MLRAVVCNGVVVNGVWLVCVRLMHVCSLGGVAVVRANGLLICCCGGVLYCGVMVMVCGGVVASSACVASYKGIVYNATLMVSNKKRKLQCMFPTFIPFVLAGTLPVEASGFQFACGAMYVGPTRGGTQGCSLDWPFGPALGACREVAAVLPVVRCLPSGVRGPFAFAVKLWETQVSLGWSGSVAEFFTN